MTKDELEEIEDLKYHISKVEPIVKEDLELAKKDDSFPIQFCANWNAATLEHKKERLQELLEKQKQEEVSS